MEALALYRDLPLAVRSHTRIRAWTCPMAAVLDRVPSQGRLLEVGCGHGLFANDAALRHPHLRVLGVDPSPEKIGCAAATVGARANVAFRIGRVEDVTERDFDGLAILDVLYLIPRREWPTLLAACRDRLRRQGRFLLKEVDVRPRWKFFRCLFQEALSVRLLGITLGSGFAFASRKEMTGVLENAGFSDVTVTDLGRGYLTPHVLYEAVRG